MDTRKQIEKDYGYLVGRNKGLDPIIRSIGRAIFVAVDVLLLPVGWGLEFYRWCVHKWTDIPIPPNLEELRGGITSIPLDATGIKGAAVSEFELDEIINFGLTAFGQHDILAEERHRMVHRFATCCPRAFRFLTIKKKRDDGRLAGIGLRDLRKAALHYKVGYTCVLPLKKNGYVAYRRGELKDYAFNEHHIVSPRSLRAPSYLCIQAFALCTHVKKESAKSLYEGIAYHLSLFVDGILASRPVLIAEAATTPGEKLLRQFSFTNIGESANKAPLYELDTRNYEHMTERARHTVSLLDAMVRKFSELRREQRTTIAPLN